MKWVLEATLVLVVAAENHEPVVVLWKREGTLKGGMVAGAVT